MTGGVICLYNQKVHAKCNSPNDNDNKQTYRAGAIQEEGVLDQFRFRDLAGGEETSNGDGGSTCRGGTHNSIR